MFIVNVFLASTGLSQQRWTRSRGLARSSGLYLRTRLRQTGRFPLVRVTQPIIVPYCRIATRLVASGVNLSFPSLISCFSFLIISPTFSCSQFIFVALSPASVRHCFSWSIRSTTPGAIELPYSSHARPGAGSLSEHPRTLFSHRPASHPLHHIRRSPSTLVE